MKFSLKRWVVVFLLILLTLPLPSVAYSALNGDANSDGVIDSGDVGSIISQILGISTAPGTPDCNLDGSVDVRDVICVINSITTDNSSIPPDPVDVAPPLDNTVATNLLNATEFLYTGSNPIQTGMAPDTIEARRVSVLRGKVTKTDETALSGVKVTILGHPEYGSTLTRADGMFDLAVNGGGVMTVEYEKEGYFPAQRQVDAPWQDFAWLPDIVMVEPDIQVTTIDLNSSAPMQEAKGSAVTDEDGTRQATVLFPQGVNASMVLQDGSAIPLTTLNVRATEYTVGPNGPEAMPGALPPTSGYTYAVELSADEAVAAGARDVRFTQAVPFYVENFLGFPVGGIVPVGYYDRDKAAWIPSENGRIIKVLGVDTGGLAEIDIDGSGAAADATALAGLGITDSERQKLAGMYQLGQSLWRVPIKHFTPWDCNWPRRPPDDAKPPNQRKPKVDKKIKKPEKKCGSIIECQNQALGETVPITGTPFRLHYKSDRVPGRKSENSLEIPLSGASVPASLKGISLDIQIGGRLFTQSFLPVSNQTTNFIWDGKDAYGRTVQGAQPASVRICYNYPAVYATPSDIIQSFSRFSGEGSGGGGGGAIDLIPMRQAQQINICQNWKGTIAPWDARMQGLGGWTLDVHHAYDSANYVLYLGDGRQRSAEALNVITTVAGNGQKGYGGDGGLATQAMLNHVFDVAVGPDGGLYIADPHNYRIRRVSPDGIITTVAGNGQAGYGGDGGLATQAILNYPNGVAVGPDGSLYIADTNNHRIRRVGTNGIITTVAGTEGYGFSGDGGVATQASLHDPSGVAVSSDGTLYIADTSNSRIRRIGTDGIITTIAGTGLFGDSGDGGLATQARLGTITGIAVGPDGSLYIADIGNSRIRQLGTNGIINAFAGTGGYGFSGDGGPGTQANFRYPYDVAFGPDGSLYIADAYNQRIRRVGTDGFIATVAGNGQRGYGGDGGLATQAMLKDPRGVAVGPDGSLYIADRFNERVRGVKNQFQHVLDDKGGELYVFNPSGRHLHTINTYTGEILSEFTYDATGLIIEIKDGDGNITTIERDGSGNPTAIVSPFAQRTVLSVNSDGYLDSITNPAGEAIMLGYGDGGLLTSLKDPRGNVYQYTYDDTGRLIKDEDPVGGFKVLVQTDGADSSYTVSLSTALGRTTNYQVTEDTLGNEIKKNTLPSGLVTESTQRPDGTSTYKSPDGTKVDLTLGPDPRWGMQAPLTSKLSLTLPSNLISTITTTRSVTLTDPNDKLSLQTQTDTLNINGRTYTSAYDATTKTYTITTPLGRKGKMVTDSQGRVVEEQDADLIPVSYTYDSQGRLTKVTEGSGTETREVGFTYDSDGDLSIITDPLGRTTTFGYDAAGRVTSQTLPDGRVIRTSYDANGNVTAVTPPERVDHSFSYTPVDLTSSYTPPDLGAGSEETQYDYNLDRQLTRITRPDGLTLNVGYDNAGRLGTLTLPEGQITYSYNTGTGNLSTITDPGGSTLSYTYDGLLLKGSTWNGTISGSIGHTFDNNLRITSQGVNGSNTISFQYDNDSLLTAAGSLTLSRNAQNGLITGTALGGVSDTWGYNGFAEPNSYSAAYSGNVIYSTQYTRDNLGRITDKTETVEGVTDTYSYTYDTIGRLTEVKKNNVTISAYTYDANGNRLTYNGVTANYDAQDRLTQYGSTTYTYTTNGELLIETTGSQTTTYNYDVLGNLKSVTLPNGTLIEYLIDGRSRQIGKKINGTLMQGFLFQDGLRPVAELDGANNIVSRFVYASRVNVPDYMIKGSTTYRIISDHLGSPRLVIDTATGTIAQRVDYNEFGRVLTDTNPGFQPFGFAGGVYDTDTGLIRFGARDYNAETGRWTAKDPIGFVGGDANLYGYVMNDPVNLIDPNGLRTADHDYCLNRDYRRIAKQKHKRKVIRLKPLIIIPRIIIPRGIIPDDYYTGPELKTQPSLTKEEELRKELRYGDLKKIAEDYPGITIEQAFWERSVREFQRTDAIRWLSNFELSPNPNNEVKLK